MSDYQFIHFLACDECLDQEQLAFMRQQSKRAMITEWEFGEENHSRDFRGNAQEMLRRGYDAHLHFDNFGIRRLMFRLHAGLPCERKVFESFLPEKGVKWHADPSPTSRPAPFLGACACSVPEQGADGRHPGNQPAGRGRVVRRRLRPSRAAAPRDGPARAHARRGRPAATVPCLAALQSRRARPGTARSGGARQVDAAAEDAGPLLRGPRGPDRGRGRAIAGVAGNHSPSATRCVARATGARGVAQGAGQDTGLGPQVRRGRRPFQIVERGDGRVLPDTARRIRH